MRREILAGMAVGLLAILASAQTAPPAPAKNNAPTQRGIQLRKQPNNVQYDIEVTRDHKLAVVPPDFEFRTGDEFALRVTLATDSYVYVLNRTFAGSPSELKTTRQVRLVQNPASLGGGQAPAGAPEAGATPFTLVYPASGHRLLKAGKTTLLPSNEFKMQMDGNPGLEELLLVVSQTPQNFAGLTQAAKADTATAVYARLRQQLTTMAQNTEADEPPATTRSIEFVPVPPPAPPKNSNPKQTAPPTPPAPKPPPSCVAHPVAAAKPYLVELVLSHNPN